MRQSRRLFELLIAVDVAQVIPLAIGLLPGKSSEAFVMMVYGYWQFVSIPAAWFIASTMIYTFVREKNNKDCNWTHFILIGLAPLLLLASFYRTGWGRVDALSLTWVMLPIETAVMAVLIYKRNRRVVHPVSREIK